LLDILSKNHLSQAQKSPRKELWKGGRQMKNGLLKNLLRNHYLAMIICCAIPLVAISALSYLGVLGPWGFYALILLCPLLHLLMMPMKK
jgi:hypothetical protein